MKRSLSEKEGRGNGTFTNRVRQRFDIEKTAEMFALARTPGVWQVKLKMRLERGKAGLEGTVSTRMGTWAFKARGSRGCAMRPRLISSVISLFS